MFQDTQLFEPVKKRIFFQRFQPEVLNQKKLPLSVKFKTQSLCRLQLLQLHVLQLCSKKKFFKFQKTSNCVSLVPKNCAGACDCSRLLSQIFISPNLLVFQLKQAVSFLFVTFVSRICRILLFSFSIYHAIKELGIFFVYTRILLFSFTMHAGK